MTKKTIADLVGSVPAVNRAGFKALRSLDRTHYESNIAEASELYRDSKNSSTDVSGKITRSEEVFNEASGNMALSMEYLNHFKSFYLDENSFSALGDARSNLDSRKDAYKQVKADCKDVLSMKPGFFKKLQNKFYDLVPGLNRDVVSIDDGKKFYAINEAGSRVDKAKNDFEASKSRFEDSLNYIKSFEPKIEATMKVIVDSQKAILEADNAKHDLMNFEITSKKMFG